MKTRSVDLAAWLLTQGIEPDEVTFDLRFHVKAFKYHGTNELRAAVKAFRRGATVPAIEFVRARNRAKDMSPAYGGKATEGFEDALIRAYEEVERETGPVGRRPP